MLPLSWWEVWTDHHCRTSETAQLVRALAARPHDFVLPYSDGGRKELTLPSCHLIHTHTCLNAYIYTLTPWESDSFVKDHMVALYKIHKGKSSRELLSYKRRMAMAETRVRAGQLLSVVWFLRAFWRHCWWKVKQKGPKNPLGLIKEVITLTKMGRMWGGIAVCFLLIFLTITEQAAYRTEICLSLSFRTWEVQGHKARIWWGPSAGLPCWGQHHLVRWSKLSQPHVPLHFLTKPLTSWC